MSTRSRIGIENPDGSVTSIYCHFDGNPEGVGYTLLFSYASEEQVKELIALGDLSYLEARVKPNGSHSFKMPEAGVTVAYHRDRGEPFRQSQHKSVPDFFNSGEASWADYLYLFTQEEQWLFSSRKPNPMSLMQYYMTEENGVIPARFKQA